MQNFEIVLTLPRSFSLVLIQSIDGKMEALRFARVKVTWSADGLGDVVIYEGRSDSPADELLSTMRNSVVENCPGVKMTVDKVA